MADPPRPPPDPFDDWMARFGIWVCVGFLVALIAVMIGLVVN